MAALLVLAGAMINDRIKEKKETKRRKMLDEKTRHRQLQADTQKRDKKAAVERNYDSEDEKEDEALPRYEDVIDNGKGSSSSGSGGNSGIPGGSEAPPDYGRRSVETRGHHGVDLSRETS